MDGVHDMGGMQGFGPVIHDEDEPIFHAEWEGRMLGIDRSATSPAGIPLDRWRYLIECIPPDQYLTIPYYSKWYYAVAVNYLDAGLVNLNELITGKAESTSHNLGEALKPDAVALAVTSRFDTETSANGLESFSVGDDVRASKKSSIAHTRLPGYVRGHSGKISAFYGWHILPDASAVGICKGEPLYSVAFRTIELWPEDGHKNDFVYIDMWESYLETA